MHASKLIAIALAALLVSAGAAVAAPGQSPDGSGADAAEEHQSDDPGAQADENATEAPPTEMPENASDQVSQIHELIRSLSGQELGAAISDLVGQGDDAHADSQADDAGEQSDARDDNADDARANGEDGQSNAGPVGTLPEQAADHVSQIHDANTSFLNGDGDGNPGDQVSGAAGG